MASVQPLTSPHPFAVRIIAERSGMPLHIKLDPALESSLMQRWQKCCVDFDWTPAEAEFTTQLFSRYLESFELQQHIKRIDAKSAAANNELPQERYNEQHQARINRLKDMEQASRIYSASITRDAFHHLTREGFGDNPPLTNEEAIQVLCIVVKRAINMYEHATDTTVYVKPANPHKGIKDFSREIETTPDTLTAELQKTIAEREQVAPRQSFLERLGLRKGAAR